MHQRDKKNENTQKMKWKSFFLSKAGISSVIAVLLILAITVLMAGYLGATVLSYEFEEPSPSLVLRARSESYKGHQIVCIEHRGGESVEISRLEFKSQEGKIITDPSLQNKTYKIGETMAICRIGKNLKIMPYPLQENTHIGELKKENEKLNILVIDKKSNRILFEIKK